MQRRVDEPDDHRQPSLRFEDALEVAALDWQQSGQVLLAFLRSRRHDHRLHYWETLLLHEHVLRPAQPNAFSAVFTGFDRIARVVGVRPDLQAAETVGPTEDRVGRAVLAERLRVDGGHTAEVDITGAAVDGDLLTFFDDCAVDRER